MGNEGLRGGGKTNLGLQHWRKSDFCLDVEHLQHVLGFMRTNDGPYWIYSKMTFCAVSVKLALGLI